jgi:large subunit ribosomal protein L22
MAQNNREVTFDAKAVLRNLRVTPQKSRRVINLVRGRNVADARNVLKFAPQAASEPVLKLLNSAVANILMKADRNGLRVSEENLFVSEVFADEGATMKRFRPRARGTAGRIFKRTSHITLFVATDEEVILGAKPTKAKADKKAKDAVVASEENAKEAAVVAEEESASKGVEKKDPSKAPGKQHKAAGPKEIKAHGDNKAGKAASAHRKENMRKKGA